MASAHFYRRRTFVTLMVMGCAASLPAFAQMPPMPQQAPMQVRDMQSMRAEMTARGARAEDGRSLSDAVRRVQRSTGGHILGAERVPYDGRDINRVKYMDERGRVRYMDDPAPSRSQPRTPRSDMSSSPRGDNP